MVMFHFLIATVGYLEYAISVHLSRCVPRKLLHQYVYLCAHMLAETIPPNGVHKSLSHSRVRVGSVSVQNAQRRISSSSLARLRAGFVGVHVRDENHNP